MKHQALYTVSIYYDLYRIMIYIHSIKKEEKLSLYFE